MGRWKRKGNKPVHIAEKDEDANLRHLLILCVVIPGAVFVAGSILISDAFGGIASAIVGSSCTFIAASWAKYRSRLKRSDLRIDALVICLAVISIYGLQYIVVDAFFSAFSDSHPEFFAGGPADESTIDVLSRLLYTAPWWYALNILINLGPYVIAGAFAGWMALRAKVSPLLHSVAAAEIVIAINLVFIAYGEASAGTSTFGEALKGAPAGIPLLIFGALISTSGGLAALGSWLVERRHRARQQRKKLEMASAASN